MDSIRLAARAAHMVPGPYCMDVQPSSLEVHEEKVHTNVYASSRAEKPGMDLNLYLQLLKEDLETLWKDGANTWDAAAQEYFRMKAAVITIVGGMTPGRVTHEKQSVKAKWAELGCAWAGLAGRRPDAPRGRSRPSSLPSRPKARRSWPSSPTR